MHGVLRLYEKKIDDQKFLEAIWEINKTSAIESKLLIKQNAIENFLLSWKSFLFRFTELNVKQTNRDEINELLLKKANWLSNELQWMKIPENDRYSLKKIIIISDPEFLTLPIELLPIGASFLGDKIEVFRKIRLPNFHYHHNGKIGQTKLFAFETVTQTNLTASIEKEARSILHFIKDKKKLVVLEGKNLRENRFKEEISIAKVFHFAGHLEKGKFIFSDGSEISSNEIADWDLSQLQIAFLNGCHSAFQNREEIGLAAAFLKAGAKEVVGFCQGVPTEDSELVGQEFWKSWEKTKSTSQSFRICKQLLINKNSPFRFTFYQFGQSLESKSNSSFNWKIWILVTLPLFLLSILLIIYFLNPKFFYEKGSSEKILPTNASRFNESKLRDQTISTSYKLKTNPDKNSEFATEDKQNIVNLVTNQNVIVNNKNRQKQEFSQWESIINRNDSFSEAFANIKSNSFQNKIKKFIISPHPLLTVKDRIELTTKAIATKTTEEKKEFIFDKEVGEFK